MSNEKVRQLLEDLKKELQSTDLEPLTRQALEGLDRDLHALLETPEETPHDSNDLADRARMIEAEFAADHPVATRIMREFIAALSRVGI